jgi:hypothetical protein
LVVAFGTLLPKGYCKNLNYKLGSYGQMNTRLKEADSIQKIDILFIGASDAYRGFDPREFKKSGFATFNLGSSSQSPLQSEILLKDYLKVLKPEKVVYAVSNFTLCSDGVESSLDFVANRKLDRKIIPMVLKVQNAKSINTLLYAWFRQNLSADNNFEEPRVTDEDIYIDGGYVEKKFLDFNKKSKMTLGGSAMTTNQFQMHAFENILDMLKKDGIELVLLKTPVAHYQDYCNSYSEIWNESQKYFSKHGKFYNFNQPNMGFVDTLHFNDQYHLNQRGVEKFNAMLIDSLLKN